MNALSHSGSGMPALMELREVGVATHVELNHQPAFLFRWSGPIPCDASQMEDVETLMSEAASLGSSGSQARKRGEEALAETHFRNAFGLALEAMNRTVAAGFPTRLDILHTAATLALGYGEVVEARRLFDDVLRFDPSTKHSEAWAQLLDINDWPDEWLIAAVRRDPPDVPALDVLAARHWK